MSVRTVPWSGHVIVCGLHDEGLRIIEQLRSVGVEVVVVDDAPDPRMVSWVERQGIPYLPGDSRLPETLEAAGIELASALICVETQDLHTLATALIARELNASVRVVVQLGNPAVARALADAGVAVHDVARLSAPAVVEACLSSEVHPLRLGQQDFQVVRTTIQHPGSLRAHFGDLAPIALVPHATGRLEVAPGRDRDTVEGDTVYLLGTAEAVEAAQVLPRGQEQERFYGARAFREVAPRPMALWLFTVRNLDRQLRLVMLAIVGLVVVSTGVLMAGYEEPGGRRMSVLDALYFTIETIGTVGYGDFYFRDQQPWLRAWAIGLMLVGATLATVFFALLTNMLVSRRIAEAMGRRKVTGLADHVVVVGLGSVGVAVCERLAESGTPVLAVDSDEGAVARSRLGELGVTVVLGDATQQDLLASLRLDRARAVAVVTSDDLANIETGLALRSLLGDRWRTVPVVLRLFDRGLAGTVEGTFGFNHVRSTAELAAPWFVGAALGLDVLGTFYVGAVPMLVAHLHVTSEGLAGRSMRELAAHVRVASLVRADGTPEHSPRRDTRILQGDTAYLVGPYEELLALLRMDVPAGGAAEPDRVHEVSAPGE